ncbi:MAG: YciI family protein [Rhodovibrionaceae bacterium]|nr:YciI family protein [Rhodovibrionaceae bacterium]
MQFAIICKDRADAGNLRQETRSKHIEYLDQHESRLVYAGPLLRADGETPAGSLLVFDGEDKADAEAFAEGDPYAEAGLFESVEIHPIRQVYPKG